MTRGNKWRDELEVLRNKRLPPGSRHHQYWCAIFWGKRCDCDDDGRPSPARRRGPASGAAERELEDA